VSNSDITNSGSLKSLNSDELGKLSTLAQISTALSRAEGGFFDVANILLDKLLDTLGAERFAVLLEPPNEERSLFRSQTKDGVSAERFEYSSTVVSSVKETGEPLVTLDAMGDQRLSTAVSIQITGARSVMCVPLQGTGLLYVDNRLSTGIFREPELSLLTILADLFSAALDRVRNMERLEAAYAALRASQEETVTRLAAAADWRDTDTAQHINRVGEYCAHLGSWAGCTEEYVEELRMASKMHDVGKLGVPDAILLKPGRFTDDEFQMMKRHTTMGGKILEGSNSPLLQMAHRIALSHHEHYDGSGYPHGLKGEDIPLEGRITSICDAFDAMCSKRVYKEAYPLDKVFGIIKSELGKQFDPVLGQLFIDNRGKVEKLMGQFSHTAHLI
jgi:response regulator RpfG family c-di-GMP phosphodiesterase